MAMASPAEALALGLESHKRGEFVRAEEMYRQVLASDPRNAMALNMLGLVALQTGRMGEALSLLEQSVASDPTKFDHLSNLGAAYRTAGRPADALATLDRALALDPQRAGLHYNRGLALADLDRYADALEAYRRSLELEPRNVPALCNFGDVLRDLGRPDESLEYFDRALAIDPNHANTHYNRSLALLTLGRLREGFAQYEWRFRARGFAPRRFTQPAWDGAPLGERTLLLYAEQGFGDTLQFIRYLPQVAERAPRYVVEVPQPMIPLLVDSGFANLVPLHSQQQFDAHVSLLSLPHMFGTTLETVPAQVPYLQAEAKQIAKWRQALRAHEGFRVGIVWQGRPTHPRDRYRSIPPQCFTTLADVPGVRLFSLQKGAGIEQIPALQQAAGVVDLGSQFECEPGDFRDTAAIVKNLDLLVSCDTACVHLAGALDVPAWVALPYVADWRWLRGRNDSPWYPHLRLFRQPAPGDWPAVFRSIAGELESLVRNAKADKMP